MSAKLEMAPPKIRVTRWAITLEGVAMLLALHFINPLEAAKGFFAMAGATGSLAPHHALQSLLGSVPKYKSAAEAAGYGNMTASDSKPIAFSPEDVRWSTTSTNGLLSELRLSRKTTTVFLRMQFLGSTDPTQEILGVLHLMLAGLQVDVPFILRAAERDLRKKIQEAKRAAEAKAAEEAEEAAFALRAARLGRTPEGLRQELVKVEARTQHRRTMGKTARDRANGVARKYLANKAARAALNKQHAKGKGKGSGQNQ